jgi:signal transduction histidine kinase/CheY-like chemotaxis protein
LLGIGHDISEIKRAEERLREAHARLEQRVQERTADLNVANAALQKAARLKDEFLASMSHELRTPLTGILGLSESLLLNTYGGLNDEQQNALRMVDKSGRHLLDLINEVLDLSKIEAGKLELQPATCALDGICQASLQMVSSLARQKNLQTSFSMHPISITFRADPRRLKQMVVNLLSNAVKFTPEHGSIGVDVVGSPAAHEVSITVWDTGIGIHPEDLPRLFQPFVQLDSSLARQFPGTGLGLAMVQRLAELHGGSVQVESVPAHGSRFTILLPWDSSDPETLIPRRRVTDRLTLLPATKTSLPPGPLVLAVDDNPIMLEVFGDYLSAQNFGFIATYSGEEFLERLESSRPGILLVDIQMPGMDGLEIIRRVRSHPEAYFASLPVVAVTALAMSGDRERCLAAGADTYLSKPVELADLASVLRALVGQNRDPG